MAFDPIWAQRQGAYVPAEAFPERWRDYLAGGDHPGTFFRDVGTASDQVPRWAWGALAVVFGTFSYMSWRGEKKRKAA